MRNEFKRECRPPGLAPNDYGAAHELSQLPTDRELQPEPPYSRVVEPSARLRS